MLVDNVVAEPLVASIDFVLKFVGLFEKQGVDITTLSTTLSLHFVDVFWEKEVIVFADVKNARIAIEDVFSTEDTLDIIVVEALDFITVDFDEYQMVFIAFADYSENTKLKIEIASKTTDALQAEFSTSGRNTMLIEYCLSFSLSFISLPEV